VLTFPFRRAAGLNYSSPSMMVALENGHCLWKEILSQQQIWH